MPANTRKKIRSLAEERGRARLPDLELIRVACDDCWKVFQRESYRAIHESQGREGGLAPARVPKLEKQRVE
jgi:hypothetical protein